MSLPDYGTALKIARLEREARILRASRNQALTGKALRRRRQPAGRPEAIGHSAVQFARRLGSALHVAHQQ